MIRCVFALLLAGMKATKPARGETVTRGACFAFGARRRELSLNSER